MDKLVELLIKNNYSISSVESFTAGMFSSMLGDVSGVSKCLKGSLVTYQTNIKQDVLNIDKSLIDNYGVISQEISNQMAIQGKEIFNSDICVSFTGNAGPYAMENKPVGYVYMSVYFKKQIFEYHFHLKGSRKDIRETACNKMINILCDLLK